MSAADVEPEQLPTAVRRIVLGRGTLVDVGLVITLLGLTAAVATLVANNRSDMREIRDSLDRIGDSAVTHAQLTLWSVRIPSELKIPIYLPPEPARPAGNNR